MGFTDWLQRRMNARTVAKIRRKGGNFMGVDVPILHSLGQERHPRETPVTWFTDGEDARRVVASGGGRSHPDWYVNLMAHQIGVHRFARRPGRAGDASPARGRRP
jgi:deazaflavin-dependent oxidoreductase (nitroreductase family)